MKREKITAWITKYALTEGITVEEGEVCSDISDTMFSYGNGMNSAHGNDWHRTPEAALAMAEEMRLAKIVSVKKQLSRLECMTFKAPNTATPQVAGQSRGRRTNEKRTK